MSAPLPGSLTSPGFVATLSCGAVAFTCGTISLECGADSRAESCIDLAPVFDRALLHLGFHAVLQMSDDIRDQVVAVGGGQHVAIQRAGLAEVVVLGVFDIRGARDLARFYLPTREFVGR